MSVKNAVKFIEDVYGDEEKRNDLVGKTQATDIVAYANESGYDFSMEELQEGHEQFMEIHGDELSDDELEAVAGGAESVKISITIEF